jgi:thymidylate synthase
MSDIFNKLWPGFELIRASSPAEAHIKSLTHISEASSFVITEHGPTYEVIFLNSVMSNPLSKDVPLYTEFTSENAIQEYARKEITGAEVPPGFQYTYGKEIHNWEFENQGKINQREACIELLRNFKNTRRATMRLGNPGMLRSSDPACCCIVDWKYRAECLNMFLVFRSHDYGSAYYPNMRGFAILMEEVANELDMTVGVMGCTSMSAHVYKGDWWKLDALRSDAL